MLCALDPDSERYMIYMFYMVNKAAVPSAFSLQPSAWFRSIPIPIPIPTPIRTWTLNP